MKVDIWRDLAENLASAIISGVGAGTDKQFNAGHIEIYDEEEFIKFLERLIKKFADERIARICFMVGEDEDISKTG